MELAFTEAVMLVLAVLVRLAVDSANADWIKLDILLIGPLNAVPYFPTVTFDALVGWSEVCNDFFFFRTSGSKSVK